MDHTKKFEDVFALLGEFIFDNKWKVSIIWFLLNGILGLGLLSLILNNDIETLYVNRHTETKLVEEKLTELYPDTSGRQFSVYSSTKPPLFAEIIVSAKGHTNLIHPLYVNETKHFLERIRSIEITSDYRGRITYDDICAQSSNVCVIEGIEIVDGLSDCSHGSECVLNISEINTMFSKERNISVIEHIGDYNQTNNVVTEAFFFRFILFLRQDTPGIMRDSKRWQKQFLEYMSSFNHDYLEVVYSLSSSLLEELGQETYIDIRYFGLAFTILLTYMGFYISGGDCVSKKVNIGRMGTIVVPLSVLGAWGLTCGTGFQFTNTVGVMPFVALYSELNNVLITMNNLAIHAKNLNARDRILVAMRRSCIPVTVTTIAYVAGFAIGIRSSFLAMEIVSLFTVTTVIFIYINHMVFFTACLAIHEQRIDASRHCCTCNIISPKSQMPTDSSCFVRCCCSGERPNSIEDTSSNIEKISRRLLSYFVLRSYVKWFVIVISVIFVGGAIWQTTSYRIKIYSSDLLTTNSFHYKFMQVKQRVFHSKINLMFVAPGDILYSGSNGFDDLLKLQDKIASNKFVDSNSVISWFEAYDSYEKSQDFHFNSTLNERINAFLKENSNFKKDIAFDVNGTIISTRLYARSNNIHDIDEIRDLKQSFLEIDRFSDSRETLDENIVKSQGGPATANNSIYDDNRDILTIYSPDFILVDKYYSPLIESLIQISTIAVSSIILTCIAYPHPRYFLLLLSSFAAAIVCVFGIMSALNVEMTSVTMILTVLGTCYVANVCTHMVCSFHQTPGTDRLARANEVLSTTSVIFLNTLLGSFLGLLVLFVTHSYVFTTVMKVMMIFIAVCLVLSVFVLPIVFSFLGPNKKPHVITAIKFPNAFAEAVGEAEIAVKATNKSCENAEVGCFSDEKICTISQSVKM